MVYLWYTFTKNYGNQWKSIIFGKSMNYSWVIAGPISIRETTGMKERAVVRLFRRTSTRSFYYQTSAIFPYLLLAPSYFKGAQPWNWASMVRATMLQKQHPFIKIQRNPNPISRPGKRTNRKLWKITMLLDQFYWGFIHYKSTGPWLPASSGRRFCRWSPAAKTADVPQGLFVSYIS